MYLGLIAEISNFIGYCFVIILSFLLNKKWTFRSTNSFKKEFLKFLGSMYIAYIVNLLTLMISIRIFHINEYLAQILSGILYTIIGYILSKNWVFKIR
jgi:putative flippase GtrA